MAINLGLAGTGGSNEQGFIDIEKAGLDAVEIEFTYGIWMNNVQARKIAELNKKLNLKLSIHAPYYINLNSKEKSKLEASKKRIIRCCEIGEILGAKCIVFHPGFYQKDSKEQTYENIKKQIKELKETIQKNKYNLYLCPETTGKPSQFGDLEDLIKLKKETGCSICVDYSHLKARYNGKLSYKEIAKKLEKANLGYLHCHFSGIEYGEKGEKRHILTSESEIKALFTALKEHHINCTIINESPDPFGDAVKMKKIRDK